MSLSIVQPPPAEAATSALDLDCLRKALRRLCGDDVLFSLEVIQTYLETAPVLIRDIRLASRQQYAELLDRAARTLHTSSALMGMDYLAGLASQIAAALQANVSWPTLTPYVEQVITTFDAAEPILRELRAEITGKIARAV